MWGGLPCYQKTHRQNGMTSLMRSRAESGTDSENPSHPVWLGLAALFALSPILLDWGLHLAQTPSARYAAIFPVLYLIGLRHDSRAAARKDGYLLLALGVLLVILSVGGGFTRWGRIAVPIILIAMVRLSGVGSIRGALTLLWFVPLPHFIETRAWPELVLFYGETLSQTPPILESARIILETGGGLLELRPSDAGLTLMASLSGISYFAAWQRNESILATGIRMGAAVLLALPIQLLAIFFALKLLQGGLPNAPQLILSATLWVVSLLWLLVSVPKSTWRPS